jgi:hypothetical protein
MSARGRYFGMFNTVVCRYHSITTMSQDQGHEMQLDHSREQDSTQQADRIPAGDCVDACGRGFLRQTRHTHEYDLERRGSSQVAFGKFVYLVKIQLAIKYAFSS